MENNFNIVTRLHSHALQQPDRLALIQPGNNQDRTLTYYTLHTLTQGYASFFANQGISHQDKALLLIPPSPDFYAVFLALMQLGVTTMLVDPGAGKNHVRACLQMLKPTILIGTPKAQLLRLYPELHNVKAFCTSLFPLSTRLKPDNINPSIPIFLAKEKHPALITFTSGSTGRPKAIVRTHGFLLQQGDALSRLMQAPQDTVEFCSFPVFVLANLSQGITTLLPPAGTKTLSTANFALVLKSIQKYNVTRLLAAPDFCHKLTLEPNAKNALQQIRHIHTGGGPVHINMLRCLQLSAPKATIMALYGSTEAEPIALQNLSTLPQQDYNRIAHGAGLPAGTPVDIINLRIIQDHTGQPITPLTKEAFNQITLTENNIGEIVVTGSLVQKGYMNKADNLETKFEVEGQVWHRTGDAGYLDVQGKLWLQGRCSAKIKTGNQLIYPFAIEAAAAMYPQIKRTAFVQINEQNILVLEGSTLPNQAESQLKKSFPYLHKFIYLKNIPVDKRHHTKILYTQLKQMLK